MQTIDTKIAPGTTTAKVEIKKICFIDECSRFSIRYSSSFILASIVARFLTFPCTWNFGAVARKALNEDADLNAL